MSDNKKFSVGNKYFTEVQEGFIGSETKIHKEPKQESDRWSIIMHLDFLTSMFKAATCVLERLLQVVLGGKLGTEEIYTKGDQLTGCNNSTVETWLEVDMERKDQTWNTVLWYYHFITSVQANVKF